LPRVKGGKKVETPQDQVGNRGGIPASSDDWITEKKAKTGGRYGHGNPVMGGKIGWGM